MCNTTCNRCNDLVALVLSDAPRVSLSPMISVVKCPCCSSLVLDDWLGWKGSGVVFRASPEQILEYVAKSCVEPLPAELVESIRAGLPQIS